jgi:hypothetical protein
VADSVVIMRGEPANEGLDYARLKEEGTELLQRLSGKVWTDYNEHDPGVTTLEQLCYALTELSYRAEFPVSDLLAEPDGRIDTKRQALFIPRRILPCNPTTEGDYRKLIVDRVRGVANVWLRPYRPQDPSKAVAGLYDILLYAPGIDPCACDGEFAPAAVRRRVRRVYCRHRNLCEDLHSVRLLKPLRAAVHAEVTVESARSAEAILAEIFFNLGNFFAPELRRVPLKSLLDLGAPPDEIFNGPLLRNGFITDDQLRPKASEIPVPEVVRVLASTRGVATVGGVWVGVGDAGTAYRGSERIPVPANSILQLDTRTRQRGGFTIRLYKDGIEYDPDPRRVRRELDKLWVEYRRTYSLMPQYREYFPDPRGKYRDLSRYYSIQNQYPDVYGIGEYGLPSGATEARRGQAKQLKGYLLVFEQLLADFFAQLAHVKDLYSTEYVLRHTYFFQYLNDSVPNVAPLLGVDYRRELPRIVHAQDATDARRNRFLDFLLALYAERLDASSVAGGARDDEQAGDERLLRAKLALLRHMVVSTHDRGRGFDYMAAASPRNVAGMEIKSRIQLGMSAYDHRPLVDYLDASSVDIADDDPTSVGRPLGRHADHIEDTFVPVVTYDEALPRVGDAEGEPPATQAGQAPEQSGQTLEQAGSTFEQAGPLRGRAVSEGFLLAASSPENYRAGSLPGESAVALVCKSPSEDRWRLVGKYPDLAAALDAARAAVEQTRELARHGRQLYIVEHTLLRFGRSTPDEQQQPGAEQTAEGHHQNHGGKFPYGFTITAVVSAPPAESAGDDYRRFVRDVIRQNAPALVVADYCFLGLRDLRRFETLYWDWRSALRRGQPRRIVQTSAALRKFLRRCRGAEKEA